MTFSFFKDRQECDKNCSCSPGVEQLVPEAEEPSSNGPQKVLQFTRETNLVFNIRSWEKSSYFDRERSHF